MLRSVYECADSRWEMRKWWSWWYNLYVSLSPWEQMSLFWISSFLTQIPSTKYHQNIKSLSSFYIPFFTFHLPPAINMVLYHWLPFLIFLFVALFPIFYLDVTFVAVPQLFILYPLHINLLIFFTHLCQQYPLLFLIFCY